MAQPGPPKLPYFAPEHTLPDGCPLPSVEQIQTIGFGKEEGLLWDDPEDILWRSCEEVRVKFLFGYYVVKFAPSFREGKPRTPVLQEGFNLLFVRQSTKIPVPTVYALFEDEKSGLDILIMEHIHGEQPYVWHSTNKAVDEKRMAHVATLRGYMNELRALPSPGYYGGVWGGTVLDPYMTRLRWSAVMDHIDVPPMKTEREWVNNMMVAVAQTHTRLTPGEISATQRRLYKAMQGHPPVFTLADLRTERLVVQKDTGVLYLTGFDRAGWYPSCWEYAIHYSLHMPTPNGECNGGHEYLERFEKEWMHIETWCTWFSA